MSRNVPSETNSPEPSDFFGRRQSSVTQSPAPTPQHLAEGLHDLWSEEAWWIGTWIFSDTISVPGGKINEWHKLRLEHTFEVHQRYIRDTLNEGGRDGWLFYVFFSAIFTLAQGLQEWDTLIPRAVFVFDCYIVLLINTVFKLSRVCRNS